MKTALQGIVLIHGGVEEDGTALKCHLKSWQTCIPHPR